LLENAAQGAQRGKALTDRMLAFARNQELKHEVIGIPELVQGMTELLRRSLGSTFRIETRFPLGLKRVLSDANQLEMALLNLAVNARDAMEDGGEIIISAQQERVAAKDGAVLKPGTYVCLSVRDMVREWIRRLCRKPPSLSSRPKVSGKEPALAFQWYTASPNNPAALSSYTARKAGAPPPRFGCRLRKIPPRLALVVLLSQVQ
jgi:hypothetical protein